MKHKKTTTPRSSRIFILTLAAILNACTLAGGKRVANSPDQPSTDSWFYASVGGDAQRAGQDGVENVNNSNAFKAATDSMSTFAMYDSLAKAASEATKSLRVTESTKKVDIKATRDVELGRQAADVEKTRILNPAAIE